MTMRLPASALLLALALSLVGCPGRQESSSSPFAGSGAFEVAGMVGALYVDGGGTAWSRDLLAAAGLDGDAGADADLLLLLLDDVAFGADVALDLGGSGAPRLLDAAVAAGLLERVQRPEETYRFSVHGLADRFGARPAPRLPRLVAGELRRFDVGGRVLLLPTIDLREDVAALGTRARRDLGDVSLALALDGEEAAVLVRRRLLPMVEGASTLFAAAMRGGGRERLEPAVFALGVLTEVLHQTEGIAVRVPRASASVRSGELIVTPRDKTAWAALLGALRPLEGAWPASPSPGDLSLRVAFDAPALAAAAERIVEEPLLDRSLEFVETVEQALARAGRLAVDGLALGPDGGAVRCAGTLSDADRELLESWLGLEGSPAADGWMRAGTAGTSLVQEEGAASGVVLRATTGAGLLGGSLRLTVRRSEGAWIVEWATE